MLKIKSISADSIGAALGLRPGDVITALNGAPARDILDYNFHYPGEQLSVAVETAAGETVEFLIEKEYDEDLGVELDFVPRGCANNCLFCFIDQQPPALRKTLYIKDDDYRLSFLAGNYITLTNLSEQDYQRIIAERLSPLYISVHATDPAVRGQLLGQKRPRPIMAGLHRLAAGGVSFHCQIVLCPGLNDGPVLAGSLRDLCGLGPSLLSLAVVPVGLTKFRERLPLLTPVGPETAISVLALIDSYQERSLAAQGRRLVYAADEFYLAAGRPTPAAPYYEGYPQLENGVGMIRKTLDAAAELSNAPPQSLPPLRMALVTGKAAQETMAAVANSAAKVLPGSKIDVIAVANEFLGPNITVAGLLAGADIKRALAPRAHEWDIVVIPESAVRAGCFIDDWTQARLAQVLDKTVAVAAEPQDLITIAGGMR